MAVFVVDGLQPDDIDIGDGEQGRRSPRSLDLPIEVRQSRRPHPRAGQLVGLGDRELLEERVTVDLRLPAVPRGLLAIAGGLLEIGCAGRLPSAAARSAAASWRLSTARCNRPAIVRPSRVRLASRS